MEPEKIIIIVIVVAVCLGAIWAWCSDLNDDISCKVWAEQWDKLDKQLKYSKLGLLYETNKNVDECIRLLNEERRRIVEQTSCTTVQYEMALDRIKNCMNEEALLTPNEMRKRLGLDETEEISATVIDEDDCLKDFTVKRVDPYDDPYWKPVTLEEPAPKKLQPLLCKMCGGTVAKKGDIYECEYCGLKYEWR